MTPSTIQQREKYITYTSEVAGYTKIKNVYIPMRDGVELCADVFLPFEASKYGAKVPVICNLGPYGKDIPVLEFGLPRTEMYVEMYKRITPLGPDACFELVDPIFWTKEHGYALVRVDSRGIGGSQGRLDPFGLERSMQLQVDAEGQDLYDAIEWSGTQFWSSGKVALSGISYYGMNCYWAAIQRPPHLVAVVAYEATADLYQATRKGGILGANFQSHWYNNVVCPFQAGRADGTLNPEQLAVNRVDFVATVQSNEYPDEPAWKILKECRDFSKIEVPFYTAGNWTDSEIHLPGNLYAYNNIASKQKWLEMHTGNHLACYYDPDHIARQKKFLDYFCKDDRDSGIIEIPRIRLIQHHGTSTFYREGETAFPPPDVEEVAFYLTPAQTLSLNQPTAKTKKSFEYEGLMGTILAALEANFDEPFEIMGTPYVELEIATHAEDQDVFVCLRAIDISGNPIILEGNHSELNEHFAKGYFRLSHRDEVEAGFKSRQIPTQPIVPRSPVTKGKIYKVTIPFLPTAFLLDKGQKISLEIGAQDTASTIPPMRHDGGDRVPGKFGGKNIVYSHGKLVLPRIKRHIP